jgi:hypothetical protein
MSTIKVINAIHPSGSTTNIVNDNAGNVTVGNNLTVTGGIIPSSSFKRNHLINGNMVIWQRGTTGFISGYSADRWLINCNGTGSYALSTDVPDGFKSSMSMSATSSTVCGITQRIESFNVFDLMSKNVTVSFWFKKTSGAGDLRVNLDYPTSTNNYDATAGIAQVIVAASPSSSWAYYTYTFNAMPANVVKGLSVSIFLTNSSSTTLNGLLTGVQLETGSVATPYEYQTFSEQLAQCQRYYYNSASSRGNGNGPAYWYGTVDGLSIAGRTTYPVQMRVAPGGANVVLTSTSGATGCVRQWDSADIPAAPFIYDALGNQVQFATGGRSTTSFYVYDCAASAEL